MNEKKAVELMKALVTYENIGSGNVIHETDWTLFTTKMDDKAYVFLRQNNGDLAVLKEIRSNNSFHKVQDEVPVIKHFSRLEKEHLAAIDEMVMTMGTSFQEQFEDPEAIQEGGFYSDVSKLYTIFGIIVGNSRQIYITPLYDDESNAPPATVIRAYKLVKSGIKKFTIPDQAMERIVSFLELGESADEPTDSNTSTDAADVEKVWCPLREQRMYVPVCEKQMKKDPNGCIKAGCERAPKASPKKEKPKGVAKSGEGAVKQKEAKYPHNDSDENGYVYQLNERGEQEVLQGNVYINKITCSKPDCDNVRYLKNSDLFQCDRCKPCTTKDRRKRRYKAKKKVS